MSDAMGPAESWAPDETGSAQEGLSEEAKQRFAAAAAAMQRIRKEERKSKKRDDRVAQTIIQFLGSGQHAHLFILIARLVARDCPSIFILAVLSLIHDASREEADRYMQENGMDAPSAEQTQAIALTKTHDDIDDTSKAEIIAWVSRMQMALAIDATSILLRLMVDEKNIDGTVLQLATFVLQEHMRMHNREAPYEKVQPLTASILQTVFSPFMANARQKFLEQSTHGENSDTAEED